jgi:predicted esterase/catechol 2,3-dioxygenase-like lactoylglutathione lyase family enzyme
MEFDMNHNNTIHGIHHITAICSSPSVNVAFYEDVLGLRLVKQTVNFDDPHTYHLYYGDDGGRPGTILTFFPWIGMPPGQAGAGMITATGFSIPSDSLEYWLERLGRHGVEVAQESRFGEQVIRFNDPHGLHLELIATKNLVDEIESNLAVKEAHHRIRGFHSATSMVREIQGTEQLLTGSMGLKRFVQEDNRIRFAMENDEGLGRYYDLLVDPDAPAGRQGSGTVHHIAFRTRSDDEQTYWQHTLRLDGQAVTEVRDRNYFKSIYFHEPGGVLFEIATDPPGFTVDERPEELGRSLKLPSQYEPMRTRIEQHLPPLRGPEFVHRFVAANGPHESEVTLVALHGTGGDEGDLIPLARRISEDAAILSPRGKVNEQGMYRFFTRLAPGVFDEQDIVTRANELADFLVQAAGRYGRSQEHMVPLGYSNGANIAAALLFVRPQLCNRAILLRPMLPLNRIKIGNIEGKEILILRGTRDRVIPPESTDQLIDVLRGAGAGVTVVEVEAGHELTETDVVEANRWLAEATKSAVTH